MTLASQHISVSIRRPANEVYAFASNPEQLPQWAAGLSGSIQRVGDDWMAESPMGLVKVAFVPRNDFGVLDHYVTLPTGITVYNPMRVFPNAEGSEVVFTLYRQPGMSDQQFADDAQLIAADLKKLKAVLEQKTY